MSNIRRKDKAFFDALFYGINYAQEESPVEEYKIIHNPAEDRIIYIAEKKKRHGKVPRRKQNGYF